MFKVTISETKESRLPAIQEGEEQAIITIETVLLAQTLEKLNLRAVFDALNPPKRSHRRKEKQP